MSHFNTHPTAPWSPAACTSPAAPPAAHAVGPAVGRRPGRNGGNEPRIWRSPGHGGHGMVLEFQKPRDFNQLNLGKISKTEISNIIKLGVEPWKSLGSSCGNGWFRGGWVIWNCCAFSCCWFVFSLGDGGRVCLYSETLDTCQSTVVWEVGQAW